MAAVKDPESGLEFYELSHPWGMYTPIFPGYEEIKLERLTYHAKHGVMTVGVDTGTVDHPLATSLGPHRNGPQIKYLLPEYKKATGREAIDDFPEWNPAHKTLLAAGIPTIENVGADLDEVSGKRCTFQGFPWKWHEGDACVIRLVAIFDPSGNYRIESGRGR